MSFRLLLLSILALLLTGCYNADPFHKDKEQTIAEDSLIVKAEYLYGFNLDSVTVIYDTVLKNQSLSTILSKFGVSGSTVNEMVQISKAVFNVRSIKANQPYQLINQKDSLSKLISFIYHPSKLEYVRYDFGDSIGIQIIQNKIDTIRKSLSGTITSSLYQTIVENDGSPALAGMLSDVYAWQIDFFGIQAGDKFNVLYDQLEIDGEVIGVNKIYATTFTHAGETFDAFWFEQDSITGYYNSQGESLKKNFLKAPLEFKRISSKFSYRRLHPVHKVYKAHLGIDYAAPSGTPVVALGDGKVIKRGYSGGAGNMIKIKHNSTYSTAYLHLKGYAKGLKVGTYVKQGEVIGYVGSTGWSTGPHLDFRVWKNGVNIDPLSLKPDKIKSLTEAEMQLFEVQKQKLANQLGK